MSQYALQLQQITKTYGRLRANDAIDLKVKHGTIHGLAGENGAGKSTLMKILFGLVTADENTDVNSGIFIKGHKVRFKSPLDAIKSGVGMVQQHFALAGPLTALDNIILGAEPTYGFYDKKTPGFIIDRPKAKELLEKLAGPLLNVPWFAKTEDLTVGYQQRLEILKLLFRQADILILDEPTAVLTPSEIDIFFKLLRDLRNQGKTIILITHKLGEVLDLCDEVTVLRAGRVTGTFSTKGLTFDTIIKAMIGRKVKQVVKEKLGSGEVLLSVRKLSAYKGSLALLKDVSFDLKKREILGIAGVEGNGQQTLVESLLGMVGRDGVILYKGLDLSEKTHEIRNKLGFGLISEDRHLQSLWLEGSIMENLAIGFSQKLSWFGFIWDSVLKKNAEAVLTHYKVMMSSVGQPIKYLSGGNQQKVVVAREVSLRNPELLIASQPTRGVDVGAIEFIHQQLLDLKKKGAGVMLISSEIEELCALSDRIMVMFKGQIVAHFESSKFDVRKIGAAMTGGT